MIQNRDKDRDDNYTEETQCKCCGYVYKIKYNYIDGFKHIEELIGDEDFIELGQTDIIEDKGGWHERIEKTTLYACPKCGCVHIIV